MGSCRLGNWCLGKRTWVNALRKMQMENYLTPWKQVWGGGLRIYLLMLENTRPVTSQNWLYMKRLYPVSRSNLPHPNWSIAKEATPRLVLYSFTTVVVVYINTMKTTFDLNFFSIKLSNIMDTHKHGNNEKLSIKSLSLLTWKLVIWDNVIRNPNLNRKVVFIVLI